MRRRDFALFLGAAAAWPYATSAQPAGSVARIGILATDSLQAWELDALRRGLGEAGWVEGHNLVIDFKSSGNSFSALAALADQMARSANVIVAATSPPTRAAMKATSRIPIVFASVGDPVRLGFVKSLARPDGNVTGVTNLANDLTSKRLALLKEAIPDAARIAVIYHPEEVVVAMQRRDADAAAKALGIVLKYLPVRDNRDLEKAFDAAIVWRADAIFRFAGQGNTVGPRMVELSLRHRLPAVMLTAKDVEAGGLMSYWTDHVEHYRRAAAYVDRILKGASPADLPVEQPTRFELAINMRTARTLGVTIPRSILLRADKVIE